MKKLDVGVKVRYIGGQRNYRCAELYLLIGRTGRIRSRSSVPGMDWDVEMDEGCYDLDTKSAALVPIEDDQSDNLRDDLSSRVEGCQPCS